MIVGLKRMLTSVRRVAVIVAAVPCLLFLSVGTAHAAGAPDVTFHPIVGGLNVHIRDTSGIDSWCSYHADWYHSSRFLLPADGLHILTIPGVPLFRLWDVKVDCDSHDDRYLKHWY
jgi:hypothetical protein